MEASGGLFWGLFGPLLGLLGASWRPLGASWGPLGAILGPLGGLLEASIFLSVCVVLRSRFCILKGILQCDLPGVVLTSHGSIPYRLALVMNLDANEMPFCYRTRVERPYESESQRSAPCHERLEPKTASTDHRAIHR